MVNMVLKEEKRNDNLLQKLILRQTNLVRS